MPLIKALDNLDTKLGSGFPQNHKFPRPNPDGSNKVLLLLILDEDDADGTEVEYPVLAVVFKWDDNIEDVIDDVFVVDVDEYERNMDLAILDLSISSVGQLTLALLADDCSVPVEVAAMLLNMYFICGI